MHTAPGLYVPIRRQPAAIRSILIDLIDTVVHFTTCFVRKTICLAPNNQVTRLSGEYKPFDLYNNIIGRAANDMAN